MTDLQYPVGRHTKVMSLAPAQRAEFLGQIEALPQLLRRAVAGLDETQIDTPYRPGGWTVRQVVHHVPESHMNAYVRCKLALTEDVPTIKPYDQTRWSETPDVRGPIDVSLALLDALHRKWMLVLRGMSPGQFARQLNHPENGMMSLDSVVAMYAWHGRHHTAHVTTLRERMGWR